MRGDGLAEVDDASRFFIESDEAATAGSAVTLALEGTRPLAVEIQALSAPSGYGSPRRATTGVDVNRVLMLIAVLARHAGLNLTGHDVYANVAGGLRIDEPAADLAVAAALLSAREDVALPPDMVIFGEISLSGALRPVGQTENRLKEARKLGFSQAVAPEQSKTGGGDGMRVRKMPDLTTFVGDMFAAG